MLHGAQFIVSEKAIEHDGFSAIQMKDGRYLSVHYKLDIDYDVESDIYLLGSAWQTVPGLDTPVNLLDTLKDWGGGIKRTLKTSCFRWKRLGVDGML